MNLPLPSDTTSPAYAAIQEIILLHARADEVSQVIWRRAWDQARAATRTCDEEGDFDGADSAWTASCSVPGHATFAAAMQPDDSDDTKVAVAKHQMTELHGASLWCARCRKPTRATAAYKCRWCGVWYCHECSLHHFGPANPSWTEDELVRLAREAASRGVSQQELIRSIITANL